MFPRVRQIRLFDQIEACVRSFPPEDIAEHVGDSTWFLVTQEGTNVPEVNVFFSFVDYQVTLEAAFTDL